MKEHNDNEQLPTYARSVDEVLGEYGTKPKQGLSKQEADERFRHYGPNRLRTGERRGPGTILVDQFKSVVLFVLAGAALLAGLTGQLPEAIAIVAVLLVNVLIGFFSEWRAVRSLEALQRMGRVEVTVRRDGQQRKISADYLVPGDVVILSGGDVVPADLRILEANNLRVDEAALTGEAVPAAKRKEPTEADTPLAERHCMLYKGTTVAEGEAEALVVATAMETELGRIGELTEQAGHEETPLERQLDRFGARMAWLVLATATFVAIAGLLAGRDPWQMVETAIALGVAAIPEGLPIVATLALARGMWNMVQRNALVNRLTAVETLGSTQVIFTDKTGTLTENRMSLRRLVTAENEWDFEQYIQDEASFSTVRRALEIGVLCNNASYIDDDEDGVPEKSHGDPTEIALLEAGWLCGMRSDELKETMAEQREVSFDPEVMMMATFNERQGALDVNVKGAPQRVLDVCCSIAEPNEEGKGTREVELDSAKRQQWLEQASKLAAKGLRVLAVADKRVNNSEAKAYEKLRFVGLLGLFDPVREGIKEAIAQCRRGGVRAVMVTGDKAATARAVAQEVCLIGEEGAYEAVEGRCLDEVESLSTDERNRMLESSIFARVSPEQKLRLVELYREAGHTVAMTGDGVNDAPALKAADIGVAMGNRGTEAARQAADMVLLDDAFSTIVAAVHQGRVIFGNIRKSVMFMLCTNVAEVLAVAGAAMIGSSVIWLPLKPLQILYLNVLTDVFPALALGVNTGGPNVMDKPPREAGESVLTNDHWKAIVGWGSCIAASVLAAVLLARHSLGLPQAAAVTVSFLTLGLAKLWFVFNLRDSGTTLSDNQIVENPWIWASIVLCLVLLVTSVYLPPLAGVLGTRPLDGTGWLLALAMSLIPFFVGLVLRWRD